jgi:predicted nucleic acid-binding Zn ribbon protein
MVPAADGSKQLVAYVVWSDVFFCPECAQEIVFWDACVDKTTGKVSAEVVCPHCRAAHTKRQLSRPFFQVHDQATGRVVEFARLQPVAVGVAGPDARNVIEREEPELLNYVLSGQDLTGSLGRFPDTPLDAGWEMYRHGMGKHRIQTHRQLYLPRTSVTLERIWALVSGIEDVDLRQMLRWVFTSVLFRCSRFNRRLPTGGGSPITGVLFIPSMIRQENPIRLFTRRLAEVLDFRTRSAPGSRKDVVVQTGDLGHLDLPENSVDYAFVDPPFGSNIFYADMNFLWESWLGVSTDREREAIVSDRALGDRKSVFDYTRLMTDAFSAVRRALKPGHWMTVEFHNSSNAVWNSISEALQGAGFVVADVRVLNKKQGSFRQVTAAGAVKSDLIISAYKPRTETEEEFGLTAGSPEAA